MNRWKPYTGLYLRSKDNFSTDRYKKKIQRKKNRVRAKYNRKLEKHAGKELRLKKINKKLTKKLSVLGTRDTLGTSLMLSLNEPPVWLDDSLTSLSVKQISLLLESKGYFNSRIETITKYQRRGRVANVTYKITENEPHLLNHINFDIKDTTIRNIIAKSSIKTHLQKKENYNVQTISEERERIYNLLRNQGYFDFHRQYIRFRVDTLSKKYKADVDVTISNPPGKDLHKQYRIKTVKVYIDKKIDQLTDTIIYNDVIYYHDKEKFSKKILNSEIALKPGELYALNKAQFTRNNVGNLQIVKFVNINFIKKDTANLTAIINIKTHKRYQVSSELGANLNVSQGQSIPGPYANIKLKNRKLFRGFESLEANANYTIQGQVRLTQPDLIIRSREYGGNLRLNFPRLLVPLKITQSNFLRSQNPFANSIYKSTKIELSYGNIKRPEYTRSNLGIEFKYQWQKGDFEKFTFSPFTLNIVDTPEKTPEFNDFLKDLSERNGINLIESFSPSIISYLSFGYIWSNIDLTKNRNSSLLKTNAELGGITTSLIAPLFGSREKILDLPFYKYYRLSADLRKYLPVTKYSNIVFRLSGGYEKPILGSDVLPYEKYFFTGGVSSNRAWEARRIGPGTFQTPPNDINYERPGEILFESNIEYRTKVSGVFHTAFFIDASNVWSNNAETTRPGSQFNISQIHRTIALGGGLGLRFDFSLLIFRLDLGYKIYDPAQQSFQRFKPLNPLYNFGIGYPF